MQHFWSLSIQGQFYLVWPLLIAVVALIAYVTRRAVRATLSVVLLVLFVMSLAYSIRLTDVNQPLAYFHSLTRVWEFALGGLLALSITSITLSRWVRLVLGWTGTIALVSCGIAVQVGSQFPGYLALWPVLAGALVLLAGQTGHPLGADRLLASRPMQYLGNLSYSLYLWHWPILVFYLVTRDRAEVGIGAGLGVIGLSLGLSVATYHFVEQPVRHSSIGERTRWGTYRFGIAAMIPLLAITTVWQLVSVHKANTYAVSVDDPDHPGAIARTDGFEYWGSPDASLVPPMVALPNEWARLAPSTCATSEHSKDLQICSSEVHGTPALRLALVGDSHVGQYVAALQPVAQRRNWQLIVMTRGSCPFSASSETLPDDKSCEDWNAAAMSEIVALRPDAVFTLASREVRVGLTEETPSGFVGQWRKLEQAGIPVLAVRDNPRYNHQPSVCASTYGPDAPQCRIPRAEIIPVEPSYTRIADPPSTVSFLDFTDYFCTQEVCPPVIGNVRIYMDDNHVTAAFMTTMSPVVEQAIDAVLSRNDSGVAMDK